MKKILVMLFIVGFLVYSNSLFNRFVWDDEEQVVNNALVHSVKNIPLFFQGSTFNTGGQGGLAGIYYKPVMSAAFSLIYTFFGPRQFFFHLAQLLLHLANGMLVFLLFRKLLKIEILSAALALIFLVHPINIEAVSYISAYQDVLFFFFGMLALLSARSVFLALVFLFLSLLSKETGIVFFVMVLFYYLLFDKKRLLMYSLSAPLIIGTYALLRFAVAQVPFATQHLSPITRVDLITRLMTMPKIVFFYLSTFFFPKDLAIAQHWIVRTLTWNDFYMPLIIVALSLVSLLACLLVHKKNKSFVFFFVWFLVGLGIHLQIFPLDMTVAERWFYFPIVGILGMIGITINKVIQVGVTSDRIYVFKKWIQVAMIVIIVALLGLRTFIRNFDWKNGLTLFSRDIKISKDAFDLTNNLGVELFRVGRLKEAKTYFLRSTELAPYWWTNWNNLGVSYERENNPAKAESYYQKAVDNGDYYLAYENFATILIRQKKFTEAKTFLETEALATFPYNQRLRNLYFYLQSQ